MTISVRRDRTGKMKHVVKVREHTFIADELPEVGGEDMGPTPHDLYDAAVGACKALTVLWYANRKSIPVEDIRVDVERDLYRQRLELARAQCGERAIKIPS